MSTEVRKRVTLDHNAHRKAEAAVIEVGASLGMYASAAVEYFATRGLDPRKTEAREGQLIMQQLKKLGDQIFGFLQEPGAHAAHGYAGGDATHPHHAGAGAAPE